MLLRTPGTFRCRHPRLTIPPERITIIIRLVGMVAAVLASEAGGPAADGHAQDVPAQDAPAKEVPAKDGGRR